MAVTAEYVASRTVGAAMVTAISDGPGRSSILGSLPVPREVWRREVDADAQDEVVLSYNVAHVRLGAAAILIDLGFDDSSLASQWRAPRHQRTRGVVAGLAALGVRPEEVTHVLITHAHGDHVAGGAIERAGRWVPRHPTVTYFPGHADWEGNAERDRLGSLLARHLGPVADAGRLALVDTERAIVPSVTMLATPGESPGHCIVRVASEGATFSFLSDLFHHPCDVHHRDWASSGRAAAALLMTTHMPFPAFERLRETPDGVAWGPA